MLDYIYQVNTNPITKENYREVYFASWGNTFLPVTRIDRENAIEDLRDLLASRMVNFGEDMQGPYFTLTDRCTAFETQYAEFKEAIRYFAENVSLNLFSRSSPAKIAADCCVYINDECRKQEIPNIYICCSDDADSDVDVITIDSFLRDCKENEKYYIGAVLRETI